MLKVGFVGGRWLGVRCLEYLDRHPHFDVVGVSVTPKEKKVWWTDVVEEDEVTRMGYDNISPDEVFQRGPEIVFSVLTSFLFRKPHLEQCDVINLHPAPLPYYRGCNSYAHAIMNGDSHYGVTLHYVDEGIDTGPIINVDWIAIEDDDTGLSLYNRAQAAALGLFKYQSREIWHNHSYKVRAANQPQDKRSARYYTRESLEPYRIVDHRDPNVERIMRAMTFPPHPMPTIVYGHVNRQSGSDHGRGEG